MEYDLSILIPAIRQNRWEALYNSAQAACEHHHWQLVLVSPFELPESLQGFSNIKLVKEFGQVSRAVQRGMLELDSDYIFLTVDDCTFEPDSLDAALEEYHKLCGYDDILNVRYSEGGTVQVPEYYRAWFHASTQLPGIEKHWQICPQFLMNKNKFIEMGGFDCQFEYINEAVHDFAFRVQRAGGVIYQSSKHCCVATWYPTITADHAPIHYAQTTHDWPIFLEMYRQPNDRYIIPYDNWKFTPEVWHRRFSRGVANSYEELTQKEGYKL